MNTVTEEPLDAFESRLLTELRVVVDERSDTPERAPKPMPTAHRPWALAGVAAAAATGLVVWNVASPDSPAYAVDEHSDGSVTFSLFKSGAADGLETALAEAGISADITALPLGQMCAPGRYTAADVDIHQYIDAQTHGTPITVPADLLAPGETLVVEFRGDASDLSPGVTIAVGVEVAEGPVRPCEPISEG